MEDALGFSSVTANYTKVFYSKIRIVIIIFFIQVNQSAESVSVATGTYINGGKLGANLTQFFLSM